jgi:palmitoyltransferase
MGSYHPPGRVSQPVTPEPRRFTANSRLERIGGTESGQRGEQEEMILPDEEEKSAQDPQPRGSSIPDEAATTYAGRTLLNLMKEENRRFCSHCLKFKPDRCHHCRQCNSCVLKMDHHCPWVINCIGFYNYKYFINMLVYGGKQPNSTDS